MTKHDESRTTAGQASGLDFGRRDLLKLTGASVAAIGAVSMFNASSARAQEMTQEWDKVFPQSENVDHEKVTFTNRYGITLAGDLYLPRDRTAGGTPAIAVSGPFGAVKEQSSGLYAQTMAERGFVTLAFDPSYTGESGGEPRNVASPWHACGRWLACRREPPDCRGLCWRPEMGARRDPYGVHDRLRRAAIQRERARPQPRSLRR